ncbi:hypothetical protein Agub_g9005, partial [Astrephomene gubernaculifera]
RGAMSDFQAFYDSYDYYDDDDGDEGYYDEGAYYDEEEDEEDEDDPWVAGAARQQRDAESQTLLERDVMEASRGLAALRRELRAVMWPGADTAGGNHVGPPPPPHPGAHR